LPETAQVQLANSRQKPEESIESWADRVMQLSVQAFPELPEEFMYQQAVKRICHGCVDKDAGQYVVYLNLDSVEQVIDKIKSFQYNHQSIYDKSKKDVREVRISSDEATSSDDETVKVRKSKQWKTSTTDEKQKVDTKLTELSKQMGDIKDGIFFIIAAFGEYAAKDNQYFDKTSEK
jgi:hypothetical protein